jgi:exopolysaccharide production protein ExoQ
VSRQIAIYAYVLLILWFFVRDRSLRPMTSGALWIPFLWLAIIGTRPISFWVTGGQRPVNVEVYLEGSPVDAGVYLALIILGTVVVLRRKVDWSALFAANVWVTAFFAFCLVSIVWSDFPFVSFKRWLKDWGNVVMILVILTEMDPAAAIRAVFSRYACLVVPLSVLFIKYVPEFGRYYDPWTWQPMYRGVGGEKNALGVLTAISCLFVVWDLSEAWSKRRAERSGAGTPRGEVETGSDAAPTNAPRADRPPNLKMTPIRPWARIGDISGAAKPNSLDLAGRILLILMCVWLIDKADSSNALVCLSLGIALVFLTRRSIHGSQFFVRNLGWFTLLLAFIVALVYLVPGALGAVLGMIGEDPTLTGRIDLWADLVAIPNNAVLGSGYQSFWLEPAIDTLWQKYYFKPNQAHNGYLDTYLNGGAVGIGLLITMIVAGGVRLRQQLMQRAEGSTLLFAFFAVIIFYNWSEAMFNRLSPVWFITLLAILTYRHAPSRAPLRATRYPGSSVKAAPNVRHGSTRSKWRDARPGA